MSKDGNPYIDEQKARSFTAKKGHGIMKYLNVANQLAAQGDVAYCNNNYEVAFVCYWGMCRVFMDHIRTHYDANDPNYSKHVNASREHVNMAIPRLEEVSIPLKQAYEDSLLGVKPKGANNAMENDLEAKMNRLLLGNDDKSNNSNNSNNNSTAAAVAAAKGAGTAAAIGSAPASTFDLSNILGATNQANTSTTANNNNNVDLSNLLPGYNSNSNNNVTTNYAGLQPTVRPANEYPAFKPKYSDAQPAPNHSLSDMSSRLHAKPETDPYGMPLIKQYTDLASRTAMDDMIYPLPKPKFLKCVQKLNLPSILIRTFLMAAGDNTQKKLETAGILAGRQVKDEYYVTHLILPEQEGFEHRVQTEREELMGELLNHLDLIQLGWIHTHPTQTCFLSAVDLHTQYSYQRSIPEAIAIVCATQQNVNGVFSISDVGMNVIGSCGQPGNTFHKHAAEYGLFGQPPHVVFHHPEGHPQYVDSSSKAIKNFPKYTGSNAFPPSTAKGANDFIKAGNSAGRMKYEIEIIDLRRKYDFFKVFLTPNYDEKIKEKTKSTAPQGPNVFQGLVQLFPKLGYKYLAPTQSFNVPFENTLLTVENVFSCTDEEFKKSKAPMNMPNRMSGGGGGGGSSMGDLAMNVASTVAHSYIDAKAGAMHAGVDMAGSLAGYALGTGEAAQAPPATPSLPKGNSYGNSNNNNDQQGSGGAYPNLS